MHKNFSVSVVIPFYNRSRFIEQGIDSINAQTLKPMEIVIVDDCSRSDETAKLNEIVAKKQVAEIPIRVFTLVKNGGVSNARNIAVSEAKGDFIAFLDSDDYWAENKLEKQMRFFAEHADFDAVHTGIVVFNAQGEITRYVNKPAVLSIRDLLKSTQVTPSSFVLKKNVFNKMKGFKLNMNCSEDYDLTIRLVQSGHRIFCINEPLSYLRRDSNDKLTGNHWNYFKWHLYLVFKYWSLYQKEFGFFAVNKFTAFYFYNTAKRIGGVANILTVCAYLIYPPFIFNKSIED